MQASFSDVTWDEGALRFRASVGDLSDDLWVVLPPNAAKPVDDLIATFFATLAGPGCASVSMSLTVSPHIRNAIERYCGCPLDASFAEQDPAPRTPGAGHVVAFSGGFDSLAARALLPGTPALISMDFGGWFQRETDFFQQFDPLVVRTNLRMAGFGRRSWMFMLAGVILLRDELDIGAFTTGSILESSPWHYRPYLEGMPQPPELLQTLGLRQINTTIGITEVATTLLTMRHHPHLVSGSLTSLAPKGTGKSLRKQMLVQSLHHERKARLDYVPDVEVVSSPPLVWGQSLTDDMLVPYMLKHAGVASTRALMAGIPEELVQLSSDRALNFYERYHTGLYQGVPAEIASHVRDVLAEAGIQPFAERDWAEYREVIAVLSQVHEFPHDRK